MERVRYSFSEELKRGLVEEIEGGRLSIRDAASEVGTGVTQVQKWLEEYGRFKPKRDIVEVVMKSEKDKIAELEKALAEAHLKVRVYDELITQANKKYKTDIKKNFGTLQHDGSVMLEEAVTLPRSAESLARPATPSTSVKKGARSAHAKRRSS
jgi:transposase-like protein